MCICVVEGEYFNVSSRGFCCIVVGIWIKLFKFQYFNIFGVLDGSIER